MILPVVDSVPSAILPPFFLLLLRTYQSFSQSSRINRYVLNFIFGTWPRREGVDVGFDLPLLFQIDDEGEKNCGRLVRPQGVRRKYFF